jgi:hypothetical protein
MTKGSYCYPDLNKKAVRSYENDVAFYRIGTTKEEASRLNSTPVCKLVHLVSPKKRSF